MEKFLLKPLHIFLTLLVFLSACWIGLFIAQQKALWGDEICTEIEIEASSYWDIIAGTGSSSDPQKAPIYLCFQKFIDQIFGIQIPRNLDLSKLYVNKKAQLVCRINPVLWMSLSIALIFYYFTRYMALWVGVSSYLIVLSTAILWCYWAEDRIYSFWFFVTSFQSLAVLYAFQNTPKRSVILGSLFLTNLLLSLTTTLGIVQIAAVSVWMFFVGYRKITDYLLTAAIPLALNFFFYSQSPHYFFLMPDGFGKMIRSNIPLDRMVLVLTAGLCLWREKSLPDRRGGLNFLFYCGIIFAAAIALLMVFKAKEPTPAAYQMVKMNGNYFIVNARYIFFLAPVGIIASTFFFAQLMQVNRMRVMRVLLVTLLVLFTVPRIWEYFHLSYVTGRPQYPGQQLLTLSRILPHH